MNQAQIGEFISEMRKEKNLTQVELGDLLGVTNKTIYPKWFWNGFGDILILLTGFNKEICNNGNRANHDFYKLVFQKQI